MWKAVVNSMHSSTFKIFFCRKNQRDLEKKKKKFSEILRGLAELMFIREILQRLFSAYCCDNFLNSE